MARSRALAVLLVLVAACGRCGSEPTIDVSGATGEPEARELHLRAPPREGPEGGLVPAPIPAIDDVLEQLDAIAKADSAKGLFLRIDPMLGSWGRVADVAEAIQRVRDAGKPVHCHFDLADNAAYWLMATACDRISMTPAGHLNLVGLAAQVFYARSLLDKIGVRAEIEAMGRYKNAADTLLHDDMPEATREALGSLLDALHGNLRSAVAAHANVSVDRAQALLDAGPYDSSTARAAHLVDDLEFDDEAREHLRVAAGAPRVRYVPLGRSQETLTLAELLEAFAGGAQDRGAEGPRLVLAHLTGPIVDGHEAVPGRAVSEPFIQAMRRFRDDDDVEAVVLRISSPGGSALASDRMWHAVQSLATKKPVVVSVGDMAASGGYYVAVGANEIFAHRASLVGSIGVIGGKIDASALAERVGLHDVVLSRATNAAWMSPFDPLTPEARSRFRTLMGHSYDRFLSRVDDGRTIDLAQVRQAAEGRVHDGARALELGLIDRIGGLGAALARARELAELDEDVPIQVWPPPQGFAEALGQLLGGADPGARVEGYLPPAWAGIAEPVRILLLDLPAVFADGPIAAIDPYAIVIR